MTWRKLVRTLGSVCAAVALLAPMEFQKAGASRRPQIHATAHYDLADGKAVYGQKCAACHFDTSDEKKIGPGLAGLMKRAKFKDGMTANDKNLRRIIEHGGKDMPGFRDWLKQKQIRDLIAYVKTL